MATTSEHDIADAVIRIASQKSNGTATFKEIYRELPNLIELNADDLAPSVTRNGEPMWRQIVRNIQSHHENEGNAIYEGWLEHVPSTGYKITVLGRKRIGV